MTAAINKFVHQLSLIQILSSTLWDLHEAGHFGFQSYSVQSGIQTWPFSLASD